MAFLGHKRAICSFSFLALVTMHAFGADPDVTYVLVDASDPMKGATTTFEVSSVHYKLTASNRRHAAAEADGSVVDAAVADDAAMHVEQSSLHRCAAAEVVPSHTVMDDDAVIHVDGSVLKGVEWACGVVGRGAGDVQCAGSGIAFDAQAQNSAARDVEVHVAATSFSVDKKNLVPVAEECCRGA